MIEQKSKGQSSAFLAVDSLRLIPHNTPNAAEDLHARLAQVEAQIAKKQGKTDRRSASLLALLQERMEIQSQIEALKKDY